MERTLRMGETDNNSKYLSMCTTLYIRKIPHGRVGILEKGFRKGLGELQTLNKDLKG